MARDRPKEIVQRPEIVEKYKHTLTHNYGGSTPFGLPGPGPTVHDAESSHLCLRLRVISERKQKSRSSKLKRSLRT